MAITPVKPAKHPEFDPRRLTAPVCPAPLPLRDVDPARSGRPVVLLGASNLTRALPLVVSTLKGGLRGRLQVLAACGHGRSYGKASSVLGRALPGIVQCELWTTLGTIATDIAPTLAALVDVGNDIAYGASVSEVLGWVRHCLDQLALRNAEIVLMALPIASIERLPQWRFELLRRVYFPAHPLPWQGVLERLCRLDEELRGLARAYDAHVLTPSAGWYGFDPIHVRRRSEASVWQRLYSSWRAWENAGEPVRPGWAESLRLRSLRPADCCWFGYRQNVRQPAFADHRLSLSLY